MTLSFQFKQPMKLNYVYNHNIAKVKEIGPSRVHALPLGMRRQN